MKIQSNILKWLTILFSIRIIYLSFKQIENLYLIKINEKNLNNIFGIDYPEDIHQSLLWIISILTLGSLFYLMYHLFTLIKIAENLNKNKVFTNKNAAQLYSIGIGIIVFASILVIIETTIEYSILANNANSKESGSYYLGYAFGTLISKRMYLYIISIFILIISSLIKTGNILKQENDLTI